MKKFLSFSLILVLLLGIGLTASAVTYDMTVGKSFGSKGLYTASVNETITGYTVSGSLPGGLEIGYDEHAVWLTGTPTAAGSYSFTVNVAVDVISDGSTTTADNRYVDISGTIAAASNVVISADTPTATPVATATPEVPTEFTITKHPGAENRTAGGNVIFIAKASNAVGATWTMVSPDGGEYNLDTFLTKYPTMKVSFDTDNTNGVYTSTITLMNVPTDISGYSAYAVFTDDTGRVIKTNSASITVTEATPSPSPTVDPASVTPIPTPVTVSTATPIPSESPTPAPVPTIAPITSTEDDSDTHRSSSGTGTIILTVLVGILTLAIAVLLILYVQGKLDLSWLEQKLEKKPSSGSDDSGDYEDSQVEIEPDESPVQVEYVAYVETSTTQTVPDNYSAPNRTYPNPSGQTSESHTPKLNPSEYEDDI